MSAVVDVYSFIFSNLFPADYMVPTCVTHCHKCVEILVISSFGKYLSIS